MILISWQSHTRTEYFKSNPYEEFMGKKYQDLISSVWFNIYEIERDEEDKNKRIIKT